MPRASLDAPGILSPKAENPDNIGQRLEYASNELILVHEARNDDREISGDECGGSHGWQNSQIFQ
jgi:hypothetical protein